MKKFTIIAAGLFLTATTFAQTWSVDKMHSRLGFSITHMTINDINGDFKSFDAKINSAKPDFSDATIELNADINSINTEVEKRDDHLKSADFFDAAKMPALTFKSKSFKKGKGKNYILTGDLTMHGMTKTVTLNAVFNGTTTNPMSKKEMAGFTVTGKFKRSQFGIGASMPESMLSDNVTLVANLEFTKG